MPPPFKPKPGEEEPVPAVFLHCQAVYEAMFAKATKQGDSMVYEGFLTKLVTVELRLSVPYYTTITRALKEMGCIKPLRRGGSTTESQWEVCYEPTLEAYKEILKARKEDPDYKPKLTVAGKSAWRGQMEQQMKDLNERQTRIEVALGLTQ